MKRFLVAQTLACAKATASVDCKWRRIDMTTYLDNDGRQVEIINDHNALRRADFDRLYLGWGFFNRPDISDFLTLARHKTAVLQELPCSA